MQFSSAWFCVLYNHIRGDLFICSVLFNLDIAFHGTKVVPEPDFIVIRWYCPHMVDENMCLEDRC